MSEVKEKSKKFKGELEEFLKERNVENYICKIDFKDVEGNKIHVVANNYKSSAKLLCDSGMMSVNLACDMYAHDDRAYIKNLVKTFLCTQITAASETLNRLIDKEFEVENESE